MQSTRHLLRLWKLQLHGTQASSAALSHSFRALSLSSSSSYNHWSIETFVALKLTFAFSLPLTALILLLLMTKRNVKSFSTNSAVTMMWCGRTTPQRSVWSILEWANTSSKPLHCGIPLLPTDALPSQRSTMAWENLIKERTSVAHF